MGSNKDLEFLKLTPAKLIVDEGVYTGHQGRPISNESVVFDTLLDDQNTSSKLDQTFK